MTAPDPDPLTGPPGAGIFALENRPAAGLYLVAWLLCGTAATLAVTAFLLSSPALLVFGIVAAFVGLPAAAGYQIVARSSRPITAYRGPSPVILFLLIVVGLYIFGIILTVLTGLPQLDVNRPDVFLVGLSIQVAVYVGIVWLFVLAPRALSWADLARNARDTAASVGTAMLVMVPVTVMATILGSFVSLLLDASPPQVVPVPHNSLEIGIDALAAIVVAPIGEELFFRGFALTAWLRDLGPRAALIRSSVFFALVHILNVVQVQGGDVLSTVRSVLVLLAVILPIGFVLGALYLRRGLVASTTAHMTYNAIVFGLLLLSTFLPPPTG